MADLEPSTSRKGMTNALNLTHFFSKSLSNLQGTLQAASGLSFPLEFLPNEVLEHLFEQSTSFLAITLYKCGCSNLNRKLAQSITTVDLQDRRWFSSSRYPKILSTFVNLRHLFIDRGKGSLMPLEDLRTELKKLPKALETLELSFHDPELLQLLEAYDEAGTLVNDKLGNQLNPPVVKEVNHFFPFLKTLRLPAVPDIPPPSLATFRNGPDSIITIHHLKAFPDSLEELDGLLDLQAEEATDPSHWEGCPKSLTSIYTQIHGNDIDSLEGLPRQLTHCDVQLPGNGHLTANIMRSLPPLSRYLSIYSLETATFPPHQPWTSTLPKSLETLDIWNGRRCEVRLTAEEINALPRTVKSIDGKLSFDWPSIIGAGLAGKLQWPPLLHTLTAKEACYAQEALKYLPKSLRVLLMEWDPTLSEYDSSYLPPCIESLSLRASSPTACISFQGLLPSKLTYLSLKGPKNTGQLSASSIPLLPSTLRTLEIRLDGELTDIAGAGNPLRAPKFPAQLKKLNVDVWAWSWFPSLPRSLTELSIQWLLNFTDEMAENMDQDFFSALPSTLVELELAHSDETPELSARSFSSLPRLEALKIRGLGYVNSGFLRTVSRRLSKLWVTLETFEPENGPFLLLPHVTSLDLGPRIDYFMPCIINNWPPGADHSNPYMQAGRRIAEQNAKLYPDPRVLSQ